MSQSYTEGALLRPSLFLDFSEFTEYSWKGNLFRPYPKAGGDDRFRRTRYYRFKMEMIQSVTLFINAHEIAPLFLIIMCLSTVKIRVGRIKEDIGNDPDTKWVAVKAKAVVSLCDCEVI
jgi:hypothetical protein